MRAKIYIFLLLFSVIASYANAQCPTNADVNLVEVKDACFGVDDGAVEIELINGAQATSFQLYLQGFGYVFGASQTLTGSGPYTGVRFYDLPDGEYFIRINNTSCGTTYHIIYPNTFTGLIVNRRAEVTADILGTTSICNGSSTDLSVDITNGTAPYSIDIDVLGNINPYNDLDPINVNPATTTTYTLTNIVDDFGCVGTINNATATVTVNDPPSLADLSISSTELCLGESTNLVATITDGTGPFTVEYSDGSGNFLVNNYNSGDNIPYTPSSTGSTSFSLVSVVDANGCTAASLTGAPSVLVNPVPSVSITPDPAEVCQGNNLQLNGNPSGGTAPYSHSWTGDVGTLSSTTISNPVFNDPTSGIYNLTYTVTDNEGCTASDNIAVDNRAQPTANDQNPVVCSDAAGGTTASVNLISLNSAIDGGAGHTITWFSDAGLTTAVPAPSSVVVNTGSIFYAEVDDGSCTNVATITYTVNSTPEANDQTPVVCSDAAGGNTATVDLTTLNAAIDGGAGNTITWYSDAGLTTAIADPANYSVTDATPVYVEVDDGNCTNSATVTYTVNPSPAAIDQTPTVCSDAVGGNTATVDLTTLNAAIDGGAGYTINWYSDAGLTTAIADPANHVVTDATPVYAEVDDGSCTNAATITYTVNPSPEAIDQTPIVCSDAVGGNTATVDLTTLNAAIDAGAGFTINWFSDAVLTTAIADPANYTVTDATPVYAEVSNGTCTNTATITYAVNPSPEAIDQTPTVCSDAVGGNTATVDLTSLNATVDGGAGNTITWYEDLALTTPVADPANHVVTDAVPVYAEVDDGSCANIATITYTVNSTPEAIDQTPIVCSDAVGGNTATVDLTTLNSAIDAGAGFTVNWYSDAGLTTAIADPANYIVTDATPVYAEVSNGSCSNAATITYAVNPSPEAIDQTPTVCSDAAGGNTATVDLTTLNAAIDGGLGNTINWYSDAGLSTAIADPANYTVTDATPVYAEVDDGTCTNVATITYTVNSTPEANDQTPIVCSDLVGGNTATVDLTTLNAAIDGGAGFTINWFSDAGLTSAIADPANYTVTDATPIYAEVSNGSCTNAATITYTVNPSPEAIDQTPVVCSDAAGGNTATVDLTTLNAAIDGGAGFTINWFSDAGLTTAIADPANYVITDATPVYAEVSNGSCTNAATITYTVNPSPAAIDQTPTVCSDAVGGNTATVDLTTLNAAIDGGAGYTINWFSDAGLTTVIADPANYVVTDATPVYAEVDDGSCTNVATISYTVNSTPEAIDQTPIVCSDAVGGNTATVDLTTLNAAIDAGAGFTINWYSDAGLTTAIADPANYTVTDATPVYAEVSNGSCSNAATITYAVNPSPEAIDQTPTVCSDAVGGNTATVDLTTLNAAIDGGAGNTITWYEDLALTTPVADPANHVVTDAVPVYAEVDDGSCTNVATISYTVNSTPEAIDQTPIVCSGAVGGNTATVDLTTLNAAIDGGAGFTINWYSDAGLTTAIADPANYTVTDATPVYAEVSNGSCSNAATITYTVNSSPEANDQTPIVCSDAAGGNTATVDLTTLNAAIDGGLGNTINWFSDAGLSTAIADPANYSVTDATPVYAEVDDGTCINVATINYTVNSTPEANDQTPIVCSDVVGGNTATVDLTTLNAAIDGGAGFTINWFSDVGLSTAIADPANYTVTDATPVYAEVDDGTCINVATISYTVNSTPEAIDQTPIICSDAVGGNTATVDLTTLNAAIDGGLGNTITWYSDAGLTTAIADPANYTVTDATPVYAEVSNGSCSNAATITYAVNPSPEAIDQMPTVCSDAVGGNTATVDLTTLNAAIDGGVGNTINWFSDAGLSTAIADPANYTVTDATPVYAEVDDGTCTNVATITYTVNSSPEANDQTPIVCSDAAGGNTATVDLTTLNAAIDGGAGFTINWFSDAGFTTAIADPANYTVTDATPVYAEISNGSCSNAATITYTVNPSPEAIDQTPTVCSDAVGGNTATVDLTTLNAAIDGGVGNTINWFSDAGLSITIADPANYTVTDATPVYAEVDDGSCTNAATVTYTVTPSPAATITANGPTNFCAGGSVELTANAGAGYTYQWQLNGSDIPGETNINFIATTSGDYTVVVTDGSCSATSAATTVNVTPAPTVFTVTGGGSFCQGGSGMDVGLDGSQIGVNYQLFLDGVALTGLNDIISGTGNALSFGDRTATGTYTVVATNTVSSCTANMNGSVDVIEVLPPAAPANPVDNQYCEGTSPSAISVDDPGAGFTINWYDQSTGGALVGTGASFNPTTAGSYYAEMVNDATGCNSTTRTEAILTENSRPATLTISGNASPGCATNEIYNVPDNAGSTYTWTVPSGSSIVSGQGTSTIEVSIGNFNGSITVMETDASGCDGDPAVLDLTLSCTLTAGFTVSTDQICSGEVITFTDVSSGATVNTTYDWDFDGVDSRTGQGPHTLNFINSGTEQDTIIVTLTLDDTSLGANSSFIDTVYINPLPAQPTITGPVTACIDQGTVNFTASPAGGNWIGVGIDASGTLDLATAGEGTHDIIYTMTNTYSCTNADTVSIEIYNNRDITLNLLNTNGQPGDIIEVPITVQGFVDIITSQFTIDWDPAQVDYVGTTQYGFANINASHFGEALTSTGKLTFSWDTLNAASLPDDAVLFAIQLQLNGQACSNSAIDFSNDPTLIEVGDANFCTTNVTTNAGTINVLSSEGTTTSAEPLADPVDPVCTGDASPVLNATGAGVINWYDDAIKSTLLATGTSYATTIDTSVPGNFTFYVAQQEGLCPESAGVPVDVEVADDFTPSVTVSVTPDPSCANTMLTFEATPTNGGSSPTYRWFLDNVELSGVTAASFTSDTLTVDHTVKAELTSSIACASVNPVESAEITVNVSSSLTASVAIDGPASFCQNENVSYTALPTNGGGAPTYEWFVNSVSVGTGDTYATNTLADGDVIELNMASSLSCASPSVATAPALTVSVTNSVDPSVTLAVDHNPICAGDDVTFTATPENGGNNPTYTWFVNNTEVTGVTGSTYTDNTFVDGDDVRVRLNVDPTFACASSATAASSTITISAPGIITPSVTITGPTEPCPGRDAAYTISSASGVGTSPSYQWYLNGSPVATGATYVTSTLAANSTNDIYLEVTAGGLGASCVSPNPVNSNNITVNVRDASDAACLYNCPIVALAATIGSSCSGTADGTIQLFIQDGSGDYRYRLNGGAWVDFSRPVYTYVFIHQIQNVTDGFYTIEVEDRNPAFPSCETQVVEATVSTDFNFNGDPVVVNPTCAGGDGSMSFILGGGVAPFDIQVNDSGANNLYSETGNTSGSVLIENLDADVYEVIVTDANACSFTESITLSAPTGCGNACAFTVSYESTPETCNSSITPDGTITFTVNGGIGPYEFILMNIDYTDTLSRQSDPFFPDYAAGEYKFAVIDHGAGCTYESGEATIEYRPSSIEVIASDFVNANCFGEPTGGATFTVTGGGNPYYFSYDDGNTWTEFTSGNPVTGLPADNSGPYNVLVGNTINDECPAVVAVDIVNQFSEISITYETFDASCNDDDGIINLTGVSGGLTPYEFSYQSNDWAEYDPSSPPSFTGLQKGDHFINIRDAVGCESTHTVFVSSPGLVRLQELDVNGNTLIIDDPSCDGNGANGAVTFRIDLLNSPSPPFRFGIALSNEPQDNVTLYNAAVNRLIKIDTLSQGSYYLLLSSETGCPNRVDFTINGGPKPVNFELLEVNNVACKGESGGLVLGNITGDYTKDFYMHIKERGSTTILHSYTISDINNLYELEYPLNPEANPLAPGSYTIELVQTQDICPSIQLSSPVREFTIREPFDDLNAQVIASTESYPNIASGKIKIEVQPSGMDPYEARIESIQSVFVDQDTIFRDWEIVERDPNNVNRYTHTFEDLFAGTYLIEVRDTSGCYISLEAEIDYDRSIFIPNVFTPNNDNRNDVFYIRNLPETGAQLVVTNRWGNIVYENDNYDNSWNGGSESAGIYFYRLKIDDQLFSGWVEIWRGQIE